MNHQNLVNSKKSVLITGETGTGKSFLAKKIHKESARTSFLQLNVAALNSNLFESELFGHVKGSFTGAINDKIGFCEAIGAGTLFLDEIGEISLESQKKLLTLIDEKLFYKVGSTKPVQFRGRLIFATNIDLEKKIEEGKFRKDLYYRLRFYQIDLKPIRLMPNLSDLINQEVEKKAELFNKVKTLSPDCQNSLASYNWPGNFRELSNTIEYLFELDSAYIRKEDVPEWITPCVAHCETRAGSYYEEFNSFERAYFNKLLALAHGKITAAQDLSGISKPTIISKLKKYGISRLDFKNLNKRKEAYGF